MDDIPDPNKHRLDEKAASDAIEAHAKRYRRDDGSVGRPPVPMDHVTVPERVEGRTDSVTQEHPSGDEDREESSPGPNANEGTRNGGPDEEGIDSEDLDEDGDDETYHDASEVEDDDDEDFHDASEYEYEEDADDDDPNPRTIPRRSGMLRAPDGYIALNLDQEDSDEEDDEDDDGDLPGLPPPGVAAGAAAGPNPGDGAVIAVQPPYDGLFGVSVNPGHGLGIEGMSIVPSTVPGGTPIWLPVMSERVRLIMHVIGHWELLRRQNAAGSLEAAIAGLPDFIAGLFYAVLGGNQLMHVVLALYFIVQSEGQVIVDHFEAERFLYTGVDNLIYPSLWRYFIRDGPHSMEFPFANYRERLEVAFLRYERAYLATELRRTRRNLATHAYRERCANRQLRGG